MLETLPNLGNATVYTGDLRELVWESWDDRTADPYIYCPKHTDTHRPSMRVYPDGAKCFTCGAYLGRREFSALFDSEHHTAAKLLTRPTHTAKRRSTVDPKTLMLSAHALLLKNPAKLEYLHKRGLTLDTIERWKLGWNGPAYTIPVFDVLDGTEGDPVTIRFRRDDAECRDGHKYWGLAGTNSTQWFGHPVYPELDGALVMLEGEFDTLLLLQEGLPAFTTTNGCRAGEKLTWLPSLQYVDTLVLARDQDVPGRESSEVLCERIHAERPDLRVINLRWNSAYKDITELWQHDPALYAAVVDRLKELLRV